jgi:hypothetical protein
MNRILQFALRPGVPIRDVEETLHLAMFAVEGLTGRVRVSLDANYLVVEASRSVLIDEGNFVGWLIARVFAALLVREFGENAFQTHRPRFPQNLSGARQVEEVCA